MTLVEAETPLEAVAKIVRHGRLGNDTQYFVRVVLTEVDGKAEKMVVIPLAQEAIVPQRQIRDG